MREILFRGKRIDNGEWVWGAFLNDRDGAFYICPADSDIRIGYGYNGNRRRIGCWYEVDPETVGQDTGIRIFKDDPDGDTEVTFIYEGDILDTIIGKGVVNYSTGCFCVAIREKGNPAIDIVMNDADVEVIGNIHDNPELLKGE